SEDAALVGSGFAELEHHADDGLAAQRNGDQGARCDARREFGRDLIVEGLGERPGANKREDGSVGHAVPGGLMERSSAGSPRGSRRRLPAPPQPPSPAAARRASALSVRSHVKSWSLRPKW